MSEQQVYFRNLNGLRFIAALLVIVFHIEQIKFVFHLPSYWINIPAFEIAGKLGVILFFVLSGFLITYLLLVEESSFKEINIRKFYLRRVLRIWPLYFLIIFLAVIILPNIPLFHIPDFNPNQIYEGFFQKMLLFVLFLPNLVLPIFGSIPYTTHTWSIGTEEQFYLIWPVLLRAFKKYRFALLISIVILYQLIALWLISPFSDFLTFKSVLAGFWINFNIDCMAIGAIFALLLFKKKEGLNFLLKPWLFYITAVSVIFMLIKGIHIPYVHYQCYSILFGILILNFAANPNLKVSLEYPVLNYLGKISYGLYMFHPITIVLALYLAKTIQWISNWFIYPTSFGLTILLAALSYRYLEQPILAYKRKFTSVISGTPALA